MARPEINLEDIELPSVDTPMAGFAEQACGKSYDVAFELKQPYQDENSWALMLPGRSTFEDWKNPSSASNAAQTIVAAQNLLDGKNPEFPVRLASAGGGIVPPGVLTVVDSKNRQAIQHLIDQASYYGGLATQLWNYWAQEWQPTVNSVSGGQGQFPPTVEYAQSQMPHWPLDKTVKETMFPCQGAALGGETTWTGPPDEGWTAKITCPDQLAHDMHEGDLDVFGALVEAAMLWGRCAEEAAGVVGLHYLNKDAWDEKQGGGLQFAPQNGGPIIADPGPIPIPFPPPIPQPPEGHLPLPEPEPDGGDGGENGEGGPVVPVPEPAEEPKKTGLSTPVKVGLAAVAGYLIYRALKK